MRSERSRGLTRRQLLQAAATTGAAAVLASPGRPIRAQTRIVLVWRPWYNFPGATTPTGARLLYEGTAPFREAHPGVDLQITFLGYQGATVAAILGGAGPDVFEDWVISDYTDQGLLLDLAPYVRQDNIDLSVYPQGMVRYLQVNGASAPGGPGFYAMPDYLHTLGQAVNLDVLDSLGLTYPEPDWTYQDWASFWLKTTYKSPNPAKARVGGALYWWPGHGNAGGPGNWYLHAWGGGYVDPNNNANTILDAPATIAFMEWMAELMNEGALVPWGDPNAFIHGGQVSLPRGSAGGLPWSAQNWRTVRWALYPMPVGPKGRFTAAFESFYAASAATRYPELCWEFIKWLTYEKTWPRYMMHLALQGPVRKDLWPEWESIVLSVAPPLRSVHLDTLVEQVQRDELWTGFPFRYSDSQAGTIIGEAIANILSRQVSVVEGLEQAARKLRGLEAAGAAIAEANLAAIRALKTGGPLQPPPVQGIGNPPQPVPAGYVVAGPGGTYTLTGDGADVWNPTANCVFAGSASTAEEADFVCRVTLLANLTCPSISPWAKAGLYVAGDLSDLAPALTLEATAQNGVWWQVQVTASAGWQAGGPPSANTATGLVGPAVLDVAKPTKTGNVLQKPIWLRLHRKGLTWTAYTSWDGRTWTQASPPLGLDAGGVWVGLFSTAHNGDFGGKGTVRAVFDHVSFPVTKFVQIGSP